MSQMIPFLATVATLILVLGFVFFCGYCLGQYEANTKKGAKFKQNVVVPDKETK